MEYSDERFKQFAKTNRLKLSPTTVVGTRCGLEPVVLGKYGWLCDTLPKESAHFAQHGQVRHCLLFTATLANAAMSKALLGRARRAEAAGLQLKVKNGDESSWYFDPTNAAQTAAAIELVGAKRKRVRVLTEDQKVALRVRLAAARLAKSSLDIQPVA